MPDNRMKEPEDWADEALRDALRSLDVPAASADFDARVLSAIRGRSTWWDLFASYLRPAMATATVSAVVTATLVLWPVKPAPPIVASSEDSARASREAVQRIDRALESPHPTYGVLMPLRDEAQTARRNAASSRWWKLHWPGA